MKELLKITIGDLLDQMADQHPDHDAVLYHDRPFRKTYAQFRDLCNTVAKGFMAMGIKKGDKVAIWATNYPEWLLTQFATAKMGAVMVTVNTNYKNVELEYLLRQSDSTTLILIEGFKDSNYVEIVNQLCPELKTSKPGKLNSKVLPFLKNVIYIGDKKHPGMYNWNDLYDLAKKVSDQKLKKRQVGLTIHEVINMQYTSGTTGFPKGVMLTHYNLVNNGKCIGDCMNFTEKDKLCIPVPLFHCFGCVLGVMACVTHGSTMVPVDYFQPLKVMRAVQDEECTALHGVPTMFIAQLEHPEFPKFKFTKLRTGIMAGSPCPVKVMKQVVEATHQVIDSEGWLHTGDVGTMDENRYFKITGRIKDLVIRGGENISPKEIEDFLYTHPAIKDVQIIGVPSRQYGEEIMACVILKDGATATEDEIRDFVRNNMARHKTPKYVKFLESFPMTASGKIQKYKLRFFNLTLIAHFYGIKMVLKPVCVSVN